MKVFGFGFMAIAAVYLAVEAAGEKVQAAAAWVESRTTTLTTKES